MNAGLADRLHRFAATGKPTILTSNSTIRHVGDTGTDHFARGRPWPRPPPMPSSWHLRNTVASLTPSSRRCGQPRREELPHGARILQPPKVGIAATPSFRNHAETGPHHHGRP